MQSSRLIGALVQIHIDRPLGSRHPEHGFEYPVNYGYLPGEIAPDGEALDAFVSHFDEPYVRAYGATK